MLLSGGSSLNTLNAPLLESRASRNDSLETAVRHDIRVAATFVLGKRFVIWNISLTKLKKLPHHCVDQRDAALLVTC